MNLSADTNRQNAKCLFSNNIMFSSYSEEIHIYDEYLDLLPLFDFDGAWNPFLYELCSLSSVYPSTSNSNSSENLHQSGETFDPLCLCLNILCWASYPSFRSMEAQWTHALVSGGTFRPLSVSPSKLPATGWQGSPGYQDPPPHHHYHQVLVVSIPGIIIVLCHENFDACKLIYHIYFTSICEVYNASRNRST